MKKVREWELAQHLMETSNFLKSQQQRCWRIIREHFLKSLYYGLKLGYTRYIFDILFLKPNIECLGKYEKNCFFHCKSSFHSWDIQILEFHNWWHHQMQWIALNVNTAVYAFFYKQLYFSFQSPLLGTKLYDFSFKVAKKLLDVIFNFNMISTWHLPLRTGFFSILRRHL